MLFSLIRAFSSGDPDTIKIYVAVFLLSLPVLFLTLSVHETAHGYVANKLGDPTASSLGRLTLNPFKHFEPIGFLMMMLVGYGWAKPVPINTRYFKKPKRDMAICAAAGPLSNLLLAIIFAGLFKIFTLVIVYVPMSSLMAHNVVMLTSLFFYTAISMNVTFAVFNLIPIPPFDGSRIALTFLPSDLYFKIQRYERYIMIGFFVLLLTDVLDPVFNLVFDAVTNLILRLFGLL
ncbi:MAG: site-2 protease family protein [Ruminococcaceae bacterium]|nr:site-2 protease family protein [Oscillospiraceae bacterium]